VSKLKEYLGNLFEQKKYIYALDVIIKYSKRINSISSKKTLYLKFFESIKPKEIWEFPLPANYEIPIEPNRAKLHKWIVKPFPSFSNEIQLTNNLIEYIITEENFLNYFIQIRTYKFITILRNLEKSRVVFTNNILWGMLGNDKSILFYEIERSMDIGSREGYLIKKENQFIYYLLNDINFTNNSGITITLGTFCREKLDYLHQHPDLDQLNNPDPYKFIEESKFKSDIFVCIHMFDMISRRAINMDDNYHFWVNSYGTFIEKMIKNHNLENSTHDEYEEFPTCYEYLIYTMIDSMCDWLKMLEHIKNDSEIMQNKDFVLDQGGSNVPYMAIQTIGESLFNLYQSETIYDHFKQNMIWLVLCTYFELLNVDSLKQYSDALFKSIHYDFEYYSGDPNPFREYVKKTYIDHRDRIKIQMSYPKLDELFMETYVIG